MIGAHLMARVEPPSSAGSGPPTIRILAVDEIVAVGVLEPKAVLVGEASVDPRLDEPRLMRRIEGVARIDGRVGTAANT